jgi:Ca2+:H+ antiporter
MRYLNAAGYLAIPLAFVVHLWIGHGKSWEPTATFILAALGVIPLARLMGESTEHLAEQTGPTLGGLLNATFGNAAELIIAIIALTKGLNEMVKASLTGSILGNLLLVAGAAMVAGGWGREKQKFSRAIAENGAGLLLLAVGAMLFPAIFHHSYKLTDPNLVEHEHGVSIGTSLILLAVYGLGLLFTLKTHSHIFSAAPAQSDEDPRGFAAHWSVKKSLLLLLAAAAGIAVIAELLVGSAETMAHHLGWSPIFVGVILLAIIGNAAEHSTAIWMAVKNKMDLSLGIAIGSSLQMALFVAPVLVFTSWFLGHPIDLEFTVPEVVAVIVAVFIVAEISRDGLTNWLEGVQLLSVYLILAILFYFLPASH